VYSASTLITRENALNPWIGSSRIHIPLEGPKGISTKLGHHWFDKREENRWTEDSAVRYWSTTEVITGEGESFATGAIYGSVGQDPPEGEDPAYPGDVWQTNIIGTKVVPTWYVKVRDRNGKVRTHIVTETEFPNSN
jgi:hypothetical protein